MSDSFASVAVDAALRDDVLRCPEVRQAGGLVFGAVDERRGVAAVVGIVPRDAASCAVWGGDAASTASARAQAAVLDPLLPAGLRVLGVTSCGVAQDSFAADGDKGWLVLVLSADARVSRGDQRGVTATLHGRPCEVETVDDIASCLSIVSIASWPLRLELAVPAAASASASASASAPDSIASVLRGGLAESDVLLSLDGQGGRLLGEACTLDAGSRAAVRVLSRCSTPEPVADPLAEPASASAATFNIVSGFEGSECVFFGRATGAQVKQALVHHALRVLTRSVEVAVAAAATQATATAPATATATAAALSLARARLLRGDVALALPARTTLATPAAGCALGPTLRLTAFDASKSSARPLGDHWGDHWGDTPFRAAAVAAVAAVVALLLALLVSA